MLQRKLEALKDRELDAIEKIFFEIGRCVSSSELAVVKEYRRQGRAWLRDLEKKGSGKEEAWLGGKEVKI